MQTNFRLYSFVNGLYMSGIQHGIQTAHAVARMSVRYNDQKLFLSQIYKQWAQLDQTIVVLSAVNLAGLKEVSEVLHSYEDHFPVMDFFEDEESLGGIMTCTSIIVPQTIYDVIPWRCAVRESEMNFVSDAAWVHESESGQRVYDTDHHMFNLINTLKSYRLA
jgi:hypothetical protein